MTTVKEVFSQINWGNSESLSGPGSTLATTASIRQHLPALLAELGILTLVDAPCGDLNWMQRLEYVFDQFIGVDIVAPIIAGLNRQKADIGADNYHFQVGDITADILPRADAVLCRDCLVHLPNALILDALANFRKAGFRYLLSTTFVRTEHNADIAIGDWRPINLTGEPFNLPRPSYAIPDNDGLVGLFSDKSLGVWKL